MTCNREYGDETKSRFNADQEIVTESVAQTWMRSIMNYSTQMQTIGRSEKICSSGCLERLYVSFLLSIILAEEDNYVGQTWSGTQQQKRRRTNDEKNTIH